MGSSGSGKTHLARQLATQLGLPVYELDQLRQRPDGSAAPSGEFMTLVDELTRRDVWIIDGHYRDVRHLVWGRAQTIVWLNYPLLVVALRLWTRVRAKRGGKPSMRAQDIGVTGSATQHQSVVTASWTQRFSRLLRTLRERRGYRIVLGSPSYSQASIVELKSAQHTQKWLASLGDTLTPKETPPLPDRPLGRIASPG